jgi:hypothetical protein
VINPKQAFAGIVAYLDPAILDRTPGVKLPAYPVARSGPFICLSLVGGASRWVALTSRPGVADARIEVPRDSVINATGRFTEQQYVAQVRGAVALYAGPLDVFVRASDALESPYIERRRPFVLPFGLAAIEAAIAARGAP